MNHSTLGKLLLATCITAATAVHCSAQGVGTAELLSGGNSCLHVIRQVQIHGVNNSFNIAGTQHSIHHSPFGGYAVPGSELGDLEIVQIAQLQQTDPACGPTFHVTIHNNSCRDVCNFHVTAVATLGRLFPHSPNATVCVEKICAGASVEVCVQLPVEALALGNHNGQVIGFQKLVVAIDSYDELAETNEANNLRALACSEIAVVTATVAEQEATTVISEGTAVNESDAAATTVDQTVAPTTVRPAAPQPESSASPDPLRSAIRMLDKPSEKVNAANQAS